MKYLWPGVFISVRDDTTRPLMSSLSVPIPSVRLILSGKQFWEFDQVLLHVYSACRLLYLFFIVVLQKKFKWGRLKQEKKWYSAISLFDNEKLNWWMINESFFRLCNRQLVLSLWSECILRRWNYNLVKPNHTEEILKAIEELCLNKW